MSTLPTAILQNIYHEVAREQVNRSALSFQRERSLSTNSQGEPLFSDHSPHFYSNPDLPGRASAKATTATIVEEEDSADGLDAFNEIEKRIQVENAVSQAIKREPTLLSPILKGKPSSPVPGYTNDVNNRYNAQAQPRAAKSSLKSIGELNSKIFERSMSVPMQKVTFAFEKGDESGKITPTNPGEEPSSSSKVKKAVKAEPEKRPRSSSTVASKGKESPRKSRAVNQSGFVKPKKKSNFFYSFADQEGQSGQESHVAEKNTKSYVSTEEITGSSTVETKETSETAFKKVSLVQTYDLYKRKDHVGIVDEAGFDPDGLFRARADSDTAPKPSSLGVTQMLPEKKIEIEEDNFPENQLKNSLKAKESEQKEKKKIDIAPVNTVAIPKAKPESKSSRDSARPQPKMKNPNSKLEIFKQQRGFSLAENLFEVSPRAAAKTQSKSTISSPMNLTLTPKPTTPSNKTPLPSKQLTPVSATTPKITFPDKSKATSSTELSRKSSTKQSNQQPPEEKRARNTPSPAKKLVTSKTQQYSTIHAPKLPRKNSANSPTSAQKPESSPPLHGHRSENEFISGRTSPEKSIEGHKEANLESFLDAKHIDGVLQDYGETLGGKPNSYVELDPGYLEPFLVKAEPVERIGTPHRIYMKIIDKILQEPDSPTGTVQTPVKSVYASNTSPNYHKIVKGSHSNNLNLNPEQSTSVKAGQKTPGGYSDKKRSVPVVTEDHNRKGATSSLYNVYMPHSPATKSITPKSTTNKETVSTPNKLQPTFDRRDKGLNATPSKEKSPREYHAPWEYNNPSSLYRKLGVTGADGIVNAATIYSQQVTKNAYSSGQKSPGPYIQTAVGRKKPAMLQDLGKISSFDATPSPRPGERLTPKTNNSGRSDLTDPQHPQKNILSNPRYSPVHRASPIGKASPINMDYKARESPQKKYFMSQEKMLAQNKVSSQFGNRKSNKGI